MVTVLHLESPSARLVRPLFLYGLDVCIPEYSPDTELFKGFVTVGTVLCVPRTIRKKPQYIIH